MFDIYVMPQYPVPFPKRHVGMFDSSTEIREALNLTDEEIALGILGSVVQDRYIFEPTSSFIDKLAKEKSKFTLAKPKTREEIAAEKNMNYESVKKVLYRAFKKLEEAGVLKDLVDNVAMLKAIENRKTDEEIIFETEIEISY